MQNLIKTKIEINCQTNIKCGEKVIFSDFFNRNSDDGYRKGTAQHSVNRHLLSFDSKPSTILMSEEKNNLICPTNFDLNIVNKDKQLRNIFLDRIKKLGVSINLSFV